MENSLTPRSVDPDADPTGLLNKEQFKLWRLWVHGVRQKKFCVETGLCATNVKEELKEIFLLLETKFNCRDERNKRKLIIPACRHGIFTEHNDTLPQDRLKQQPRFTGSEYKKTGTD
jgi:hypothetical protein